MSSPSSAAIIDIGSNSIKVLVARREASGLLSQILLKTIDARISAGISAAEPVLSEEGMQRGVQAVQELLAAAAVFQPDSVLLVATSAVRDASNGATFRQRVLAATGHSVRLLSGDEEANFIGRGLTSDPSLLHARDFYVFDLGGGSLECLAFRDRQIQQAVSLRLGCVRLTERFLPRPEMPLPDEALAAIRLHVRTELETSGFRFSLPPHALAIATGGTMTTTRQVLGAPLGLELAQVSPVVTLAQINSLRQSCAALSLAERRALPGMPFGRADVFPTALVTFEALAGLANFPQFINSLYNLRWGLAAHLLLDQQG